MANQLLDLLMQRATPPPAPPTPTEGMNSTGLYGPAMFDREAQTSAMPPDVAEQLATAGKGPNPKVIEALRRMFEDPRYRAANGLVGSGVPLNEPAPAPKVGR